jgi:hypothetical protein
MRMAGGIEIPFAVASGREVNVGPARAFGRDLARTMAKYLSSI